MTHGAWGIGHWALGKPLRPGGRATPTGRLRLRKKLLNFQNYLDRLLGGSPEKDLRV